MAHTSTHNQLPPHLKNKRAVFMASITLIALLFIVALAVILTRSPKADEVTSSVGRLAKRVTINNGKLNYTQGGQPKTATSNAVDIRIKAVPKVTFKLQGNSRVNQLSGVTPLLTVVPTGGDPASGSIVRSLPATSTAPIATDNTKDLRSSFDSDQLRDGVNATNNNVDVIITVPNYLSARVTNVSDPKNITFASPLLAGNFVDSGESKNKVDEADAAKCGPAFNQPITLLNKGCDLNLDGAIDESDFAVWGPNFGKSGAAN